MIKNYLKLFFVLVFLSLNVNVAKAFFQGEYYYEIKSSVDMTVEVSRGYSDLRKAYIPSTVRYENRIYDVVSIRKGAFEHCYDLILVSIPKSVTSIGDYAFENGKIKEFIVDKDNPKYSVIDGVLFNKDGTKLIAYPGSKGTTYVIPDGVTAIGNYAFSRCYNLNSVTIPDNVISIGHYAFRNCYHLLPVTIPNSVISIGEQAFSSCERFTSIKIPSSVTTIGSRAFWGCKGLREFIVDENNPHYSSKDGLLLNKEATTIIAYPNSKSGIYVIPNDIISIGNYAFSNSSILTSITIGKGIMSIGEHAFEDCPLLYSIYCLNPFPISIEPVAFSGIRKSMCVLYVPTGTKDNYSKADVWRTFQNIIEFDSSGIVSVNSGSVGVLSNKGEIIVRGVDEDSLIIVYNSNGQLIYCGKNKIINIPSPGFYIVKTEGKIYKVIL